MNFVNKKTTNLDVKRPYVWRRREGRWNRKHAVGEQRLQGKMAEVT